jgi:hypothetical protein
MIILAAVNTMNGQNCDLMLQGNPGHATKVSPEAEEELLKLIPFTVERTYCNEDKEHKDEQALWDLRDELRGLKASEQEVFAYRFELLFVEESDWHTGPDNHQESNYCVSRKHHVVLTEKPTPEHLIEILDYEDYMDMDYGFSYFWFENKYMILQLCSEYIGNSSWGTHVVAYFRIR